MNFEKPLVSVLITNHNYASYLKESIDSVLNQTYPNLEIIVVDDGSTDNSREIITGYKDKVIPVFKENGGQASAVNSGFAISQGEIICFLDSDDLWFSTKVEQVVEAANSYPNAAILYHKVQNTDKIGTPTGKPWPPYKVIKGDISKKVSRTGGWWPFPPSTALSFRRSFMSKVMDIPEEEYRLSAEPYLTDLAPFFGEIVGIDQVLSMFRIHGSNHWSNPIDLEKRAFQHYEIRTEILNRTLKNFKIDVEVSLANHLPYQMLKLHMSDEKNLFHLSRLSFQNPWEPRFLSKLKAIIQLWIESYSSS